MILTKEEIEGLIRKNFPLFELGEEDEEDRKETIKVLLKAQLKKVKDELGRVLDEPDDKLRLALGYMWQALLEEVKE